MIDIWVLECFDVLGIEDQLCSERTREIKGLYYEGEKLLM